MEYTFYIAAVCTICSAACPNLRAAGVKPDPLHTVMRNPLTSIATASFPDLPRSPPPGSRNPSDCPAQSADLCSDAGANASWGGRACGPLLCEGTRPAPPASKTRPATAALVSGRYPLSPAAPKDLHRSKRPAAFAAGLYKYQFHSVISSDVPESSPATGLSAGSQRSSPPADRL